MVYIKVKLDVSGYPFQLLSKIIKRKGWWKKTAKDITYDSNVWAKLIRYGLVEKKKVNSKWIYRVTPRGRRNYTKGLKVRKEGKWYFNLIN